MILFGTYAIRGRHTQISSQGLSELGPEVDVISVERYALKNFVEDVSKILADNPLIGEPEIRWENGKIWFVIGGKSLPVTLQSIYVAAARIFAVLECQGKRMKVALGDEVEIFDGSRRKLSGMRLKGEKLILERRFRISRLLGLPRNSRGIYSLIICPGIYSLITQRKIDVSHLYTIFFTQGGYWPFREPHPLLLRLSSSRILKLPPVFNGQGSFWTEVAM